MEQHGSEKPVLSLFARADNMIKGNKDFKEYVHSTLEGQKQILHNASFYLIYHDTPIKLWWGDVGGQRLEILQTIAQELNVPIVATREQFHWEFVDASEYKPGMTGYDLPRDKTAESSPPLGDVLDNCEALILPKKLGEPTGIAIFQSLIKDDPTLETIKEDGHVFKLGPELDNLRMSKASELRDFEKANRFIVDYITGLVKNGLSPDGVSLPPLINTN